MLRVQSEVFEFKYPIKRHETLPDDGALSPYRNSIQLYLVTIEGSRCLVVLVLTVPAI